MKNKKMKTYNRPEIQVIVADSVLLSADSGNGHGEAKQWTKIEDSWDNSSYNDDDCVWPKQKSLWDE